MLNWVHDSVFYMLCVYEFYYLFPEWPTVTLRPAASTPYQEGPVISTCRATGKPTPHVYWVDDVANSTANVTINTSGLEATMTLQNATAHDSGRFRCVAENEAGMAVTYFHIYCKRQPQ